MANFPLLSNMCIHAYIHMHVHTHTQVILKIHVNNTLLKYIEILGMPLDSTR